MERDKVARFFDILEYILIRAVGCACLVLVLGRIFGHDWSGFLADFGR
jgi:hypothetical protein